jgi:hypothetical protein
VKLVWRQGGGERRQGECKLVGVLRPEECKFVGVLHPGGEDEQAPHGRRQGEYELVWRLEGVATSGRVQTRRRPASGSRRNKRLTSAIKVSMNSSGVRGGGDYVRKSANSSAPHERHQGEYELVWRQGWG